jgi:LuxR family transcriptional regulator, quorum-sensing system regulator SdiA
MSVVASAQPPRELSMNMTLRAEIFALIEQLDQQSPSGFAIALHIRFAAPRYLFQSYPKNWMDHYSRKGLVTNDPTIRWAMGNAGRVRWSELEAIDTAGVLEQAKNFGILNGVTVAVLDDISRSIASFARADRDFDEAEMDRLEETFTKLHRATAEAERLDELDEHALKELSIRLTH